MDVGSRVELPDGHLVNLSPRNRHQTSQSQQQYQAYRANYTVTELSASPISRTKPLELGESRSPPDNMFYKTKTTKLPVPKSLNEQARDQRNQTPSPTGIPKPPSTIYSSGGSPGQSGGRDQYWTKIREKFERESPLSHRVSYVRSRESDRNRSLSHGSPRSQSTYVQNDSPARVAGSPRSGIPTPYISQMNHMQSSSHEPSRHSDGQTKGRNNGGSWVSLDLNDATPRESVKTDTTTESSPRTNSSISPVSAEDSSTDWEDRFVVNMPSAKDPNPPTMTAEEIAEYQKSLERARRDVGRSMDPNKGQGSRNASPAGLRLRSPPRDDRMSPFNAYDGGSPQGPLRPSGRVVQEQRTGSSEEQRPLKTQDYYSPDEIGKNRISTIWEESRIKQREKGVSQAGDGSFLGCKEINGPDTRNPDEILLFTTGEDYGSLQPRPLVIGGRKKQKEEKKGSGGQSAARKPEERNPFQEEWAEVSQNSKRVQCSKRSLVTLCQETPCSADTMPRPASQSSEKENSLPAESGNRWTEKAQNPPGDDDIFIITPTITRTLIPMAEKRHSEKKTSPPRPQGLRRPADASQSGTGEAIKAVRAKPQIVSTPSGLRATAGPSQPSSTVPSEGSSKTTPPSSIPTPKPAVSTTKDLQETEESTQADMKDPKEGSGRKGMLAGKLAPGKDKSDVERSTASGSIRGFIRTSGLARSGALVRSPTDSLASILRNGTESLRNRAESLRNSRKASPISLPSRDNSESSRSEKSFKSAKGSPRATPPPTVRPSPKRESPSSKLSSVERPPTERSSSFEKSPPQPTEKKEAPAEKPPAGESSPPGKLTRAERLEKFKEEARIRRAAKMALEKGVEITGIAELDGHQVTGRKNKLQSNITDVSDVCEDLHELNARDKDDHSQEIASPVALSMIFEIVVVAITNMHRLALQATNNPYVKFVASNVFSMLRHCSRVFARIMRAVAQYQATGTWPKAKNDKAISRFLVEVLQAVVYLIILGFSTLIVYRTASYAFLIVSWFLWLVRPLTLIFNCITHALII